METNFVWVGKVDKSFGTEGMVRLKLNNEYENIAFEQDFLFILHDEIHIPYRVIKKNKSKSLIRFDDIDSWEDAESLKARKVFISADELGDEQVEKHHIYHNFEIYDMNSEQSLGKIVRLVEMPQQYLAYLDLQGQTVMVPIHEDLIDQIDFENKILYMILPDGLLSLYI